MLLRALAAGLLIALLPLLAAADGGDPLSLYQSGDLSGARSGFESALRLAEKSGNKQARWQALMAIAWFEDELSEHRKAIEHSNAALAIAKELQDSFRIGRSLAWLGWAYAGLGLYEMAEAFYTNAAELGAPGGEIRHVAVWGLATQELGALQCKMGRTGEGRTLLEKTYTYAAENGIDVGVAEGGAHLGEILLSVGQFQDAEKYAKAAVDAAERCNCSPYNLTRARLVLLKIRMERRRDGDRLDADLEQLRADCERLKHIRCLAEAKLLQSKRLPPASIEQRTELVTSALESLATAESEIVSEAEIELGRVFLDANNASLAKFYSENGLRVSAEMLRKVDKAYMTRALADVHGASGDVANQIKALEETANAARETQQLPAVLEAETKLAELRSGSGYLLLAYEATTRAIDAASALISANAGAAEAKQFESIRLRLMEQQLDLALRLNEAESSDGGGPPL